MGVKRRWLNIPILYRYLLSYLLVLVLLLVLLLPIHSAVQNMVENMVLENANSRFQTGMREIETLLGNLYAEAYAISNTQEYRDLYAIKRAGEVTDSLELLNAKKLLASHLVYLGDMVQGIYLTFPQNSLFVSSFAVSFDIDEFSRLTPLYYPQPTNWRNDLLQGSSTQFKKESLLNNQYFNTNGITFSVQILNSSGVLKGVVSFLLNSDALCGILADDEVLSQGSLLICSVGEILLARGVPVEQTELVATARQSPFSQFVSHESSFTQDQTQMRAIINQEGDYVVGCVTAGSYGHWTNGDQNPNFQKMALLAPLTGPEGVSYVPTTKAGGNMVWFITKDCANPDLAFRLGEFAYNPMVSLSNRFGVYGKHWTDDPALIAEYYGSFESIGIQPKYAVLENVWNVVQNFHLNDSLPHYNDSLLSMSIAETKRSPEVEAPGYEHVHATHYRSYWNKASEEILGKLIYSEAELETLQEIQSEINSYVSKSISAFVTGKRSLDEWEEYLNELEVMGLSTYTAILQAAYERTL